MNLKKLTLSAATGLTLLAAAPAFADPQRWAPAHGWRAQHHQPRHYHRAPAYVYYQPRPVIYGSIPIGDTRVRIGLQF